MFELYKRRKQLIDSLTFPEGIDVEYDELCNDAFFRTIDLINDICHAVFVVLSYTCIYFFTMDYVFNAI